MQMELNMGMKVVLQWILKTEFGSAHDQMKNSYEHGDEYSSSAISEKVS
jgi:hypothetical protein